MYETQPLPDQPLVIRIRSQREMNPHIGNGHRSKATTKIHRDRRNDYKRHDKHRRDWSDDE